MAGEKKGKRDNFVGLRSAIHDNTWFQFTKEELSSEYLQHESREIRKHHLWLLLLCLSFCSSLLILGLFVGLVQGTEDYLLGLNIFCAAVVALISGRYLYLDISVSSMLKEQHQAKLEAAMHLAEKMDNREEQSALSEILEGQYA